jgi:polar amino acid transport system substrate-binding protein
MKICNKYVFIVFIFFSNPAISEKLKFITIEIFPWAYHEEGNVVGVFSDIVDEIELASGHKIVKTLMPFGFSRINKELEYGRKDCAIAIVGKDYEDISILGEKLFDHSMGVFLHSDLKLESYEDLLGLTLSVNMSLLSEEEFYIDDRIKKEFDPTYAVGIKKIARHRVDGMVGAITTIQSLAKSMGLNSSLGEPMILVQEPVSLQCSKKSKNIRYIDDINKAIKIIKENGVLDAVLKKYA